MLILLSALGGEEVMMFSGSMYIRECLIVPEHWSRIKSRLVLPYGSFALIFSNVSSFVFCARCAPSDASLSNTATILSWYPHVGVLVSIAFGCGFFYKQSLENPKGETLQFFDGLCIPPCAPTAPQFQTPW